MDTVALATRTATKHAGLSVALAVSKFRSSARMLSALSSSTAPCAIFRASMSEIITPLAAISAARRAIY
jgi:hypothetical protein